MKIKDILNRFPRSQPIYSIYDFKKVPGIYLMKFRYNCGYIGQSVDVCHRLRNTLDVTPIMRFLKVDPKAYPLFLLARVKDQKKRRAMEKELVEEFAPILLNIEHSPRAKRRDKIDRKKKAVA